MINDGSIRTGAVNAPGGLAHILIDFVSFPGSVGYFGASYCWAWPMLVHVTREELDVMSRYCAAQALGCGQTIVSSGQG